MTFVKCEMDMIRFSYKDAHLVCSKHIYAYNHRIFDVLVDHYRMIESMGANLEFEDRGSYRVEHSATYAL